MTFEEAALFIEGWNQEKQERWEQVRLSVWAPLQSMSSKSIDIKELFPLPWEKEGHEEVTMTEEDYRDMWAEARRVREQIEKDHE